MLQAYIVANVLAEIILKPRHYDRNTGHNPVISYEQAKNNPNIRKLPPEESIFHRQGPGNEYNEKYVDDNGNEWVFRPGPNNTGTLLTPDIDPINAGSFNYGADPSSAEHFFLDILPWIAWGNGPNDTTTYESRYSKVKLGLSELVYKKAQQFLAKLEESGGQFGLVSGPIVTFGLASEILLRSLLDPIIIDRDDDGIELIARASSNVYFDMDGDGRKELTGWVGKDDGLLAIDENRNGKIDSIVELIGDAGRSGFAELLTYDLNRDKIIDSKDGVFSKLVVWTDANSNGVTDAGELKSLANAGIKAIDLNFTTVNFTAEGNRIHEQSKFERTNGTVGTVADAWFDVDNVITQRDAGTTGQSTIDTLPDVPGYGNVASLRTVMARDGALTSLVVDVVNRSTEQMAGVRTAVENIVYRWTGMSAVATDSRGPNFDGRKLAALEQILGTPFGTATNPDPTAAAAVQLRSSWDQLVDSLMTRLLLGGTLGGKLDGAFYVASVDQVFSASTPSEIIADFVANVPAGSTIQIAEYWAASLPVARTIATEQGIDTAAVEWTGAVNAALRSHGLANFADLLDNGIIAAPISAVELDANGVFKLSDAASGVHLFGSTQAVYALGGNDKLIAISDSSSDRFLLDGGDGSDTLQAGYGTDWLDGGAGADVMAGGGGDDTYTVDDAGDVVTEAYGEGVDTVRSTIGYALGANLDNLVLLGSAALTGTGNDGANGVTGNSGANVLRGFGGGDTLDGGAGADTLYGGLGNDLYVVDAATDRVIEEGGDAYDEIRSSVSYALPARVERLVLTGTANINATGNNLNNVLVGNGGANVLNGSLGSDELYGGGGNDTYHVDSTGDRVSENADEGTDLVHASVSFTLGSNVERLTLTGTADLAGYGNSLANTIVGNAGDNWLNGQAGADRMTGGLGDDTYVVDDAGDVVAEVAGQGTDGIWTQLASYRLGTGVETLRLYFDSIDAVARSGTGNTLDNTIWGTNGVNTLLGLAGDDRLYGYGGTDTLRGDDGNDLLDGGSGDDALTGGGGDDRYVVDAAGDRVTEAAGGGTDTVVSSVSYILSANLENLELGGSGDIDGQGNAAANRLIGQSGRNGLDGGAGADVMAGGDGNDTYTVDDAGDVVTEAYGEGVDTVRSTISYGAGTGVENITLLGSTNLSATGNELNNVIVGNAGANIIAGQYGTDRLSGGAGADRFVWSSVRESGTYSSTADRVLDFDGSSGDRLDFRKIDANPATAADDVFEVIAGSAGFTKAGQVRSYQYNGDTWIEINTDADAEIESAIVLSGVSSFNNAWMIL